MDNRAMAGLAGRRGFTLVELLIVISIMLILMGLLMAAVATVQRRSKEAVTGGVLQAVGAALEMFHTEFDSYPASPSTMATTADYLPDDGSLFEALNGTDGKGVIRNGGKPNEKRYAPFLKLAPEQTRDSAGRTVIVDGFGQPIRYFNCEAYMESKAVGLTGAAAKAQRDTAAKDCHNRNFELYSVGADGKFDEKRHNLLDDDSPPNGVVDEAAEGKDDICNWERCETRP